MASVAFQQGSYSASEGGIVQVCAVISSVPTGGLECPVVATLAAVDGKAGEWQHLDFFCSIVIIIITYMYS